MYCVCPKRNMLSKIKPKNILCITSKGYICMQRFILLTEICHGVVVCERLPQGRLMLVVMEAEDLAIGVKGTVSRSCIFLKQLWIARISWDADLSRSIFIALFDNLYMHNFHLYFDYLPCCKLCFFRMSLVRIRR